MIMPRLAFAMVLTIAVLVLPIIAMFVIGTWALVMLLLFILWLVLYRYPAFEVIYPRLRKRILVNNSHVYTQLPVDSPSIRVVRLKSGNADDTVECALTDAPLVTMGFEALSHVWDFTLMPYTVPVSRKPFYVTYNLYSALKESLYSLVGTKEYLLPINRPLSSITYL
ncbi:hypothetical protein BDV96DRAFT_607186 [Lophiotrema nucula]|uniref:Uncharacterized protein n=1 Tax=Lophiotrema nucula TaxID=690887 RepID=A0A6A5YKM1_9PLEO|nr:hypothetical protein BDV96DRAFT_607186 [Lophiotrema nucula]